MARVHGMESGGRDLVSAEVPLENAAETNADMLQSPTSTPYPLPLHLNVVRDRKQYKFCFAFQGKARWSWICNT